LHVGLCHRLHEQLHRWLQRLLPDELPVDGQVTMRCSPLYAGSTLRLGAALVALLAQGIGSPRLALSQVSGCELQPSSGGRPHAARVSETVGEQVAASDSRTFGVAPAELPATPVLPAPCAACLLVRSTPPPVSPHLDPPRFARGPPALLGS
jgi:hypothetical protein